MWTVHHAYNIHTSSIKDEKDFSIPQGNIDFGQQRFKHPESQTLHSFVTSLQHWIHFFLNICFYLLDVFSLLLFQTAFYFSIYSVSSHPVFHSLREKMKSSHNITTHVFHNIIPYTSNPKNLGLWGNLHWTYTAITDKRGVSLVNRFIAKHLQNIFDLHVLVK